MRTRHPVWARWAVLGLLGLGLVLAIGLWRRGVALTPPLQPLPQDPLIQVYFNQSQAAAYREPYRGIERLGDDLEQVIVEAIASAQSSLDVAVQELRLPRVAKALAEQHRKGVRVRVILENTYNQSPQPAPPAQLEQLDERDRTRHQEYLALVDQNQDGQLSPQERGDRDALVILATAQVPLIDDRADGSRGSDLMHHKFVVVDGRLVLTGSVNFSTSEVHGDFGSPASRGNANHLLRIASPALAAIFTEEFETMWGDGPEGRPDSQFGLQKRPRGDRSLLLTPTSRITVQFSPTSPSLPWQNSTNGLIGRVLNTARRSVDQALFVFSDQGLGDVLEGRHQQGVAIRTLIDPSFLYRSYSEGLDLLGVQLPDNRCRYEAGNRPWGRSLTTVGSPTLPEGDLLHHKFAIVDERTVITGSHNWSAAANHGNDEALLVIENATVAAHFQREFERLYGTANLGVPGWLREKIEQTKRQCGLAQ